jgi:hypothetical protein
MSPFVGAANEAIVTALASTVRDSTRNRARIIAAFVVALSLFLVACGSDVVTSNPTALPSSSVASQTQSSMPVASTPTSAPSDAASPTDNTTGFAFAADDIAGYYETQGYVCTAQQPSTKAAGFAFRTCQTTDDAGRTRVIGLVTDPAGGLADAFASVEGTDAETILAPIDALDPLSGFLGATLGEEQGTALLTWLASHLGDTYSETMSGPLKVATYTASETDHSTLYVELANRTYLDAPPVKP